MRHTKSSYDRDELIECAMGRLFGPGNAQLPLPPMLMLDRVTHITMEGGPHGRGELIAELDIDPSLWFFACHFHGDPVMPGCLGLDAMWQLVGFFLGWTGAPGRGRALGVGEVTGLRPVTRDEANRPEAAAAVDGATGVFLTGGNQLRLSSVVGGTATSRRTPAR